MRKQAETVYLLYGEFNGQAVLLGVYNYREDAEGDIELYGYDNYNICPYQVRPCSVRFLARVEY